MSLGSPFSRQNFGPEGRDLEDLFTVSSTQRYCLLDSETSISKSPSFFQQRSFHFQKTKRPRIFSKTKGSLPKNRGMTRNQLPAKSPTHACVPPGFLCWRSSSEAYNGSSSTIPMGHLFGNLARLLVSVVYEEYQKAKARKRRPSYTPLPRLARLLYRLMVFLLRGQMKDMVARRDLLVQQVRASARWELMKE
ncbi:hypothetical protein HID58_048058 [Brassica napus]|uniref:Uncharacterized protein n=1 Tax=Brassica napus TaxID=3708 RepID=A0ABQ8B110_BRANA|nr:hypothetical protein HID58_048058 [Brassica napus]